MLLLRRSSFACAGFEIETVVSASVVTETMGRYHFRVLLTTFCNCTEKKHILLTKDGSLQMREEFFFVEVNLRT